MSFSSRDRERLFDKLSACRPSRRAGCKALADFASAFPRPRTSGVVGPEPDTSFIYASIQNDEFGRRGHFPTFKLLRELIQPFSAETRRRNNPGYLVCEHAKLETCFMSLEGIRAWTRWAHKMGVQFNGPRGYKFPPKRVWNTSDDCLNYLVTVGKGQTHKRSEAARKRRRERRSLRVLKGIPEPVYGLEPIVDRPRIPARVLRIMYDPSKETWKSFKEAHQRIIPSVNVKHVRGPVPQIVIDSINKIYSKSIRVYVVPKTTIRAAKQAVEPLRVDPNDSFGRISARSMRIQDLRAQISDLKDSMEVSSGTRWYNLNHMYTQLSCELKGLTGG